MKIILIGFMGSGKSSVAKQLAILFQLPVLEMDDLVLKKTGSNSMQELFDRGGELLLRETEIAVARELADVDNVVISTGGGVVLNKVILDYLKQRNGKIIYLDAPFQTIAQRLGKDISRPLFKSLPEAQVLYQFRLSLYLHYADHVVAASEKQAPEIAQDILNICIKDTQHG